MKIIALKKIYGYDNVTAQKALTRLTIRDEKEIKDFYKTKE